MSKVFELPSSFTLAAALEITLLSAPWDGQKRCDNALFMHVLPCVLGNYFFLMASSLMVIHALFFFSWDCSAFIVAFTADLACFHFHASGRRLSAIRRLCRILWENCSFHFDSRQGIHSFFFLVLVHLQCIAFFFSSAALGCDRALRIRNHSLGNARRSGLARHLASVAWTAAQRLRDFFCLVFDA